MVFFSSLFSASLMWLMIWLLTRRTSRPVSLLPVLWICIGSTIFSYLAIRLLGNWGLLAILILIFAALLHWCCLSVKQAILVTGIWLAAQVLFGLYIAPHI